MKDDDLANPYRRRLSAPWPFLYSVVPDCGLVMNVGPQAAATTTTSRSKVPKPDTEASPPTTPGTVRRVTATRASAGAAGRGKARKIDPPPPVLDWVAPSSTNGATAMEARLDAMGVSASDRLEVLKFAAFLNDSTSMKLPELIERHGAAYLGFTEAELASLPRPSAEKP